LEALEDRMVLSTFTVTNTSDSGAGSLRQAILDANAAPGADVINFDPNAFSTPQTIRLLSSLPDITDDLTINGPLAAGLTISGDANNDGKNDSGDVRILSVSAGNVTLSYLTLTNGRAQGTPGKGGAMYVAGGTVTLNDCTLSNDTAAGGNGASTSQPGGVGGAGGAGEGGAIYAAAGAVTLNNSTLSNDTAAGGGPGATRGGGLYNASSTLTMNNTIIAGNSSTQNDANIHGSWSGSNNLLSGDPKLAPLGDYGGPTQTMALLPGSPALDAGDNSLIPAGLTTDQRGFARVSGAAVDIGADEVQQPILSPATLPDGTYGTAYSQTLTAAEAGYQGAFTFTVTAGALPTGLSLDGTAGTLSGTPTVTGAYTFTVTATDSAGFTGSQSYTLTIDKAALTITVNSTSKTYGQTLTFAGTEFTTSGLVNGDTVSSVTLTSAGAAANAGVAGSPYAIVASTAVGSGLDNYTISYVNGSLTVSPAALTITAGNQSMTYGGSVPALTYHYSGLVNGDSSASFTGGLATTATPSSGVGSYAITQGNLAATGNYTIATFNGGALTVTAAPLSAAAANFSATAGAPFSGAVATFSTPDQIDGAAAYTAVITWGDGTTSLGVITGSNGSFTIRGSHTYAAAGSYAAGVQITSPNTQSATANDTASVTSLGQGVTSGMTGGIGFWNNNNGQALLDSFNGGPTATALGNWLAATFPNLYGPATGANNLAGKSNAQVAAYFQTLFALGGNKVQAQVLAVALNVYATTSSLGGSAGTAYGFTVSATGLGARSFGVGQDGAAFGVANNSTLSVYALLAAVNKKAVNGVLYGGNTTLQAQCANLFDALDGAGSIG
jgi:hypothetical protein